MSEHSEDSNTSPLSSPLSMSASPPSVCLSSPDYSPGACQQPSQPNNSPVSTGSSPNSLPLGAEASNIRFQTTGRWAQDRRLRIGPMNYETHHLAEITRLRIHAENKRGRDPIGAWIELIYYMDEYIRSPQLNLSMTAAVVYSQNMQKAADAFYKDPQYVDDPRYISMYMKNARCQRMPPVQERRLLVSFLDVGHGRRSVELNIRIADLYIEEGEPANAIVTLQRAIFFGTQPRQLLDQQMARVRAALVEEVTRRVALFSNQDRSLSVNGIPALRRASSSYSAWDALVARIEGVPYHLSAPVENGVL